MNRKQFQTLADERAADAEALLAAGRWSGAYYLAGYAVECALKACIAKLTNQDDFPRDRDFVQKSYTHRVETLAETAQVLLVLKTETAANPAFRSNWLTVSGWDEASRYKIWTEAQARILYDAVTSATHGVLPWIRVRW